MPILCEDLARYGVCLVAPSAPEYQSLIADIVNRLHSRPKGGPPVGDESLAFTSKHDDDDASAVLLNRADRAIASIAYIWHVRLTNGHVGAQAYSPGTNASVLLPFELNQTRKKFNYYWQPFFLGRSAFFGSMDRRWETTRTRAHQSRMSCGTAVSFTAMA